MNMAEEKEGVSAALTSEGDAADKEFEPTVEMMVNDFDDERTLDEEEALEEGENQEEEVNNLTKEQNMPIEQLLAIYGDYEHRDGDAGETNGEVNERNNGHMEEPDTEDGDIENDAEEADEGDAATSRSSGSEENLHSNDIDKDTKLESMKLERRKREKHSELAQLYPELDANGDATGGASSRSLRSGSRQQSEDEDDEGEEGSGEEEEDWRKTIMIGSAYQAQVPEGLQTYGDTPPYENEDRLLWEPEMVTPEQVESYLNTFGKKNKSAQNVTALPLGTHVRDDEYALHMLLQCGYNVEEALRRHRMNPNKRVSQMTLWSEEECRNFENGLRTYGKDFHLIQQNKVRTRSVGELVQFYYLWKKTERHDMFATKTRIEKKKYIVHPGTTDYMDRFLDEGEGGQALNREAQSIHTLLYGKCTSGVAPPIPTATLASATIAFVDARSQLQNESKSSPMMSPSSAISPASCGAVGTHNRPFSTPTTTVGSFRSRSSSPKLDSASKKRHFPGIMDPEISKVNNNNNNNSNRPTKSILRGIKRPHSPIPDRMITDRPVTVSITQSITNSSIPISVDAKSHHQAETVAL